ncbi:glycosyltransferase family 39 protein [Paraburkholderia acidiphila]|uniref:glycosyltransferase family 39 protein n=1 Tax=Paraburkholderia acidiphila TaxID=2571747 RepID=UPI001E58FFE2|nr:glycosyltransferase family 39 protein [Paraburkholderia acidiphila]
MDSSADRHRNAPSLLWLFLAQALVWTLAAWLSRGNLDTQGDMVENYVWGVEWQAGYAKHPPLFAWITAAWFKVFPHWDIAYFGLSAFNAMLGLLGIVALAGRFLPRQLAFAAGLAMAVSPLYSNLAIKFNANSVLLSVWPWAAYWFVRFMQTGTWRSALAFGALAGAAILGKYFSVVLLLAFLVAAFARPAWRARLLDWRTLIAAAAFLAVLAPHVHWLVTNHFPTFGYAKERTGGTLVHAALRLGVYTLAQAGYLLLSFGFVVFLVRDRRGEAARLMLKSLVRPSLCPDLWWLTLAPLFAVAFVALAAKTQMASVWGMAQWFAIVPMWLVVLKTNEFDLAPRRSVNLLIGYWLLVLVATPAVGYIGALRNSDDAAEPRKELAAYAQTVWAQQHGAESIPVVMGSVHEAESIAFYSSGHTHYWDIVEPNLTPWLSRQDAIRQGAVLVCRPDDAHCRAACAALAGVQPVSVDIRKHAWNRMLPSRRYVLYFMPPR